VVAVTSTKPGEISLAHHGVLFLDELPEFDRRVLEVLREPMESGGIVISRAATRVTYPARFQVVGAMNPCPCGYQGHPSIACQCSPHQILRYQGRLSGPLLDRFDIHAGVPVQEGRALLRPAKGELDSATVRRRVQSIREHQAQRGCLNAALAGQALHDACAIDDDGERILERGSGRRGERWQAASCGGSGLPIAVRH